jgi:hypothetical protein
VDHLDVVALLAAREHLGDVAERRGTARAEVAPAQQHLHEDVRPPDDLLVVLVGEAIDDHLEGGAAQHGLPLHLDLGEVLLARQGDGPLVERFAVRRVQLA